MFCNPKQPMDFELFKPGVCVRILHSLSLGFVAIMICSAAFPDKKYKVCISSERLVEFRDGWGVEATANEPGHQKCELL